MICSCHSWPPRLLNVDVDVGDREQLSPGTCKDRGESARKYNILNTCSFIVGGENALANIEF